MGGSLLLVVGGIAFLGFIFVQLVHILGYIVFLSHLCEYINFRSAWAFRVFFTWGEGSSFFECLNERGPEGEADVTYFSLDFENSNIKLLI